MEKETSTQVEAASLEWLRFWGPSTKEELDLLIEASGYDFAPSQAEVAPWE